MSPKTPLQDSPSKLEDVWREMEEIEPLTPVQDALRAYMEAAKADAFLFGDYDGYKAYNIEEG